MMMRSGDSASASHTHDFMLNCHLDQALCIFTWWLSLSVSVILAAMPDWLNHTGLILSEGPDDCGAQWMQTGVSKASHIGKYLCLHVLERTTAVFSQRIHGPHQFGLFFNTEVKHILGGGTTITAPPTSRKPFSHSMAGFWSSLCHNTMPTSILLVSSNLALFLL